MRVRLDGLHKSSSNSSSTGNAAASSGGQQATVTASSAATESAESSGAATAAATATKNKPPRPYSFRPFAASGLASSATTATSTSISSSKKNKSASALLTSSSANSNCSSAHSTATGDFSMSESDGDHQLNNGNGNDEVFRSASMGLTSEDNDYGTDELVAVDEDVRMPLPRPSSDTPLFESGAAAATQRSRGESDDVFTATNSEDHVGQHPSLQAMCVMNTATHTRIIPNGPPAILENECFYGSVMLLVRTPEVDDPDDTAEATMGEIPRAVSEYFRGKKRRFEFQFQIKLKKVPTGALFLGCELEHMIRVGTITKGLVGILLAMVRRINPGFHYSWGDQDTVSEADRRSGNYEKTHLSFPVEASMDRIVITKPGEALPTLGEELVETLESVRRRRKMGVGSVDWNTEDVFTMCLWSAYADWIKWKSLNVPGVTPFSLSRVTGTQPIYLSVYEIRSCAANEYKKKRPPHKRQDLLVYTRLEFTNVGATRGGLAERVLGRSNKDLLMHRPPGDNMSLPDTESVDSDFETTSRVTCS